MARFSSKYSALVDDKGRVVLPAVFKKAMGELADAPLVIEKDVYKPCLNIFPRETYDERLEKIAGKLNPFNESDDELLDEVYENFMELTMAPNGRINIPSAFLEYAGIVREVVFVGKGSSITLWDGGKYDEVKAGRRLLRDMVRERLGNNPENEAR